MAITRPVNLTKPFADAAGVGYVRTIPEASQIGITPGAASLTDGFPPLNFLDPTAGGVPPSGQDMNGILKILSQHTAFQGSGGCYRFDAALSTAMGGYPVGAVLQDNTGVSSYINILAGNTTDFNSTPASIGVSWMPYGGAFQATETIPGKAKIATQTQTNNIINDATIVTPLKLGNGFVISLGTRGYIRFPTWLGSLVIQWGKEDGGANTSGIISYPAAFPTNFLFRMAKNTNGGTGSPLADPTEICIYATGSTTTFAWQGTNINTNTLAAVGEFSWIAIGY